MVGSTATQTAAQAARYAKTVCPRCGARRIDSQLGLEPTPEAYVESMVEVFREVRRVLRRDGTVWLNLGDCYASSPRGNKPGDYSTSSLTNPQRQDTVARPRGANSQRNGRSNADEQLSPNRHPLDGLKPKDLVGIPWRVAFALQADGWWLRSDIIWSKSNPMPESVTDRPTKSHEYLFLLSKSQTYYYDHEAIKEPSTGRLDVGNMNIEARLDSGAPWQNKAKQALTAAAMPDSARAHRLDGFNARWDASEANGTAPSGRNRRTVWEIPTQPYAEAHFAMYPEALVLPCIQAGTSEHGCCAECGAPWRRVVQVVDPLKRLGAGYHDHTDDMGRGQRGVPAAECAPTTRTTGWRPTCTCCDAYYRGLPRTKDARKLAHQDAIDNTKRTKGIGGWWKRAYARPGLDTWPRERAIVLDPFMGSGTTAVVAKRAGRDYVGVELNGTYAEMARRRVGDQGVLL